MKTTRCALMISISFLAFATPVVAQTTAPAPEDATTEEQEIIVTGTSGAGTSRQDAAFAVTTLNADAIARTAPTSTADLFKAIPPASPPKAPAGRMARTFLCAAILREAMPNS
jgi:iron complex outermembrane recepter protein